MWVVATPDPRECVGGRGRVLRLRSAFDWTNAVKGSAFPLRLQGRSGCEAPRKRRGLSYAHTHALTTHRSHKHTGEEDEKKTGTGEMTDNGEKPKEGFSCVSSLVVACLTPSHSMMVLLYFCCIFFFCFCVDGLAGARACCTYVCACVRACESVCLLESVCIRCRCCRCRCCCMSA